MKYNVDIPLHDEISRLFTSDSRLWDGINEWMSTYLRCEVIGAAEGRVEGEVKEGNLRMNERWSLSMYVFGIEHAIRSILRLFEPLIDDFIFMI